MNSKHFDKFYKNSAFNVKGKNPARENVIKTILDKIVESFPNETSGEEMSIALSLAITIILETMGIKDSKLIDYYLVLLNAEVKRIWCMVNDNELVIKPIKRTL